MTKDERSITIPLQRRVYLSYRKSKFYEIVNLVNWSYRWRQFKDRIFYIIGFIVVISLSKIPDWPIIGPIFKELQMMQAIPNDTGLASTFTLIAIMAILVVSWDLLGGYSGQVSFGHALYLGLGAYGTHLSKVGFETELPGIKFEKSKIIFHMFPYRFDGYPNDMRSIYGFQFNFGFIQAMMVAALFVTLFAIFVAILTLRSKGAYFALITLVLPLIFQEIVQLKALEDLTGGKALNFPDNQRIIPLGDLNNDQKADLLDFNIMLETEYPIILAIAIICILTMYIIAKSRIGIIFQAIREDELATSASGINVNFYKVLSNTISAFFAAIAGGLILHPLKSATPSVFAATQSFLPIIFTIVGGIGSITGAVIGTIFLRITIDWFIKDAFRDLSADNINPSIEGLALAVLLIIILRFQPRGLIRIEKRFKNAIIIALSWTILLLFYDASDGWILGQHSTGLKRVDVDNNSIIAKFFHEIRSFTTEYFGTVIVSPETFLFNHFEDGVLGINILVVQGRIVLYFIIGIILGYFGPDLMSKTRLKFWGVWPSLGKYDPPT